jgi:GNAT superfamily N-acetyltransferase
MVIIRQATSQDIPRILELYEELTEEKQDLSAETVQRVFDQIAALPDHEFLVAEKDDLVIGTLFVQVVPNLTHQARPWAVLENMVVDKSHHRQGIGRALIKHAAETCREKGCFKMQLLSHKKRLPAHQFYRDLGFEESALGFRLYL